MSGKSIGDMILSDTVLTSIPEGISTYSQINEQLSTDGYVVSSMLSGYSLTSHVHNDYLSAVPVEYKTYDNTVSSLSNDGYLTAHQSLSDYWTKSETSSATEISIAMNSYSEQTLNMKDGGTISASVEILGDLGVSNAAVNVLSGNYVQTSTPSGVHVYSGGNSFIQAESTTNYGSASIGSMGFIVVGVVSAENKVVLSVGGGLSSVESSIPESCYGEKWSVALKNKLDAQFSEISTVGEDYVVFKSPLNTIAAENGQPSAYFINLLIDKDDNALYCPTHPEVGNLVIPTFTSNHAEGGSTHAVAQFAHAEGRHTFAEGRYSHAEGHETIAAGTAAHAEGMGSKVLNNYGTHAEGYQTSAFNRASHSEGQYTSTKGNYSHAEGYNSKTGETLGGDKSEGAHAEGYQTLADGDGAHSEGRETIASDNGAHAEGYKSQAMAEGAHAEGGIQNSSIKGGAAFGKASHAEGYATQAKSLASHAEGRESIANSNYSHVEGYNTKTGNLSGYADASGEGAHAEGSSSEANGKGAHAEGVSTKAIGNGAHAEGVQSEAQTSYSHAEGYNTRASGEGAHAEGSSAKALANYAHAEGYQSEANNVGSHAAGFKAKANANYSWCWNGINSTSTYTASKEGSFCINPKNGLSGFYLGADNFIQCVLSAVSLMNTSQRDTLRGILGIA